MTEIKNYDPEDVIFVYQDYDNIRIKCGDNQEIVLNPKEAIILANTLLKGARNVMESEVDRKLEE